MRALQCLADRSGRHQDLGHEDQPCSVLAGQEALCSDSTERVGEPLPLRYCVKVTCPVPVTWDAPPAVSLYSSHPTGSRGWLYWVYFDLYTEGAAASPGGYCTADGELAETYQG